MAECLYLFPDTNLFIQCKELDQLDWSEWESFDEVHLIVSRPVQREIDEQRKRGNSRVSRRARKTYSSLFRPIATGEKDYLMFRESGPCVKLLLQFPSLPDPDLLDTLDYDKADDEIVGCLSRYTKENPEADARLLTDDTGPMMTARGLGLKIAAIDPGWKLQTENDDAAREILRLNTELVRLRKQEPEFVIRCMDGEGRDVERLELVYNIYEPLEENDISEYIDTLKERNPLETEFNQRDPNPYRMGMARLPEQRFRFESVSDEVIVNYTDREYPQWVEDCYDFFAELHETLQRSEGQPSFRLVAANEGGRPGKDALVVIRARGNLLICPPPWDDDESENGDQTEPRLPSPPDPPRGRWRTFTTPSQQIFEGFGGTAFRADLLGRLTNPRPIAVPRLRLNQRRDPNAFYYKPTRITEPTDAFSLECEQWRHGTGNVVFGGTIFLEGGETKAAGILECEIHAENLSDPVTLEIPVRIQVQYLSSRDYADRLVNPDWTSLFDNTS